MLVLFTQDALVVVGHHLHERAACEQLVPPAPSDYRSYYANIRDVLLGTAELAVTLRHALNVMRVLEVARESNARRCTIPWRS